MCDVKVRSAEHHRTPRTKEEGDPALDYGTSPMPKRFKMSRGESETKEGQLTASSMRRRESGSTRTTLLSG
jgi:hypothetical protein